MALTVNWRWNMPQVGSPNYGSEQNAKYLNEGLGAIAQGILKAGENKRADDKQKWLEDKDYRDFQHKVAQDKLEQANETRNYFLRYDQLGLLKDKQKFDMDRLNKQDAWLQKFYDQYFGDDPDEIERIKLREELRDLPGWQDLI